MIVSGVTVYVSPSIPCSPKNRDLSFVLCVLDIHAAQYDIDGFVAFLVYCYFILSSRV